MRTLGFLIAVWICAIFFTCGVAMGGVVGRDEAGDAERLPRALDSVEGDRGEVALEEG